MYMHMCVMGTRAYWMLAVDGDFICCQGQATAVFLGWVANQLLWRYA